MAPNGSGDLGGDPALTSQLRIVPVGEKPEERSPGVFSRGLAFTGRVMLFETEVKAGSERPAHAHAHDQVGYVVRGEIEVVAGKERHTCRAGDSFAIPGGVTHSIIARRDALFIDAFNQVAPANAANGRDGQTDNANSNAASAAQEKSNER